jgi:hypothetical protein
MLSVCTVLKLGNTDHIVIIVQIFAVLKENNTRQNTNYIGLVTAFNSGKPNGCTMLKQSNSDHNMVFTKSKEEGQH